MNEDTGARVEHSALKEQRSGASIRGALCYVYHVLNAYKHLMAGSSSTSSIHPATVPNSHVQPNEGPTTLEDDRTLDPDRGTCTTELLSDRCQEFHGPMTLAISGAPTAMATPANWK